MKAEWDHIQRLRRLQKEYEQLTARNPKLTVDKTKRRIKEIKQIFIDNKIKIKTKKEQS
jgi:hypothetical protein